jgi:phosphatidylserine decarboxylase
MPVAPVTLTITAKGFMITKYGYDVVFAVSLLTIGGSLLAWFLIPSQATKIGVLLLLIAFLAFTLNFFRDPDRVTPQGDNLIISPADGEVVLIQDIHDGEYLMGEAKQVSIFMSPLNVHVNRFPISGRIGHYKYFPGEYLVAFDEKSSTRNERTHIGVERGGVKVLFKQIAGFVARRIVANVSVGDTAVAGERFGMIKFGSRVDLIIPRGSEVRVALGESTVAGETVIAVVPSVVP